MKKPVLEVVPAAGLTAASALELGPDASAAIVTGEPPAQVRQAHHVLGMNRNPFPPTPDAQGYFFTEALSSDFAETLHCIRSRKGFVLITGEVGLGKSTFVRNLLDTLVLENTAVSLVLNTFLQGGGLLSAINDDFGLGHEEAPNLSASHLSLEDNLAVQLTRLNTFLLRCAAERKNCVLIIDDAQNLNHQSLELVRLLCNVETGQEKLLQIVLVGQPELLETLSAQSLRQLKSRIVKHVQLLGLTMSDTSRYIDYRMHQAGLSAVGKGVEVPQIHLRPEAVTALFSATLGNPRRLNLVMDRCLYGLVASRTRVVTPDLVRAGVAETTVTAHPTNTQRGDAAASGMHKFANALARNFKGSLSRHGSVWAALAIAAPALALAGWIVLRPTQLQYSGSAKTASPAALVTAPAAAAVSTPAIGTTSAAVPSVTPLLAVVTPVERSATAGVIPPASSVAITTTSTAVNTSANTCATRLSARAGGNGLLQVQAISPAAVALYGNALEALGVACLLNQPPAQNAVPLLMWQKTAISEQVRAAQPNVALQLMQRNLQSQGLLTLGAVDGWFGPLTQDALKRFQAKYNLPQSGELDALTTLLLENFNG